MSSTDKLRECTDMLRESTDMLRELHELCGLSNRPKSLLLDACAAMNLLRHRVTSEPVTSDTCASELLASADQEAKTLKSQC